MSPFTAPSPHVWADTELAISRTPKACSCEYGVVTKLGPEGIDLGDGRIVQPWGGDGIEIDYTNGATLIVTPGYWPDQKKWYLNIDVYGTKATEGTFGKLAKDSWLPALPDGTSLGPKPASSHERYIGLYEKFADAWRVTDATSLFDYAPGTAPPRSRSATGPGRTRDSCEIAGTTVGQAG